MHPHLITSSSQELGLTAKLLKSSDLYTLPNVARKAFILTFLFLVSCGNGPSEPGDGYHLSGETMGTTFSIKYRSKTLPLAESEQSVQSILSQINATFSTYTQESELSRLNTENTEDSHLTISAPLAEVLQTAQLVYEQSHGAFDVTVGPLVNLWGFGPKRRPPFEEIEAHLNSVRSQVGGNLYSVNAQTLAVVKKHPSLNFDLSALAKGYAVDKLAEFLMDKGVDNFIIEIGGEVRANGFNGKGQRWQIGIEKPLAGERIVGWVLALQNQAMASSGDYRNYFEHNDRRYSHLIDPRSGRPSLFKDIGVTVVHDSAMLADAWATAMTILGEEQGLKLAEALDIAVQFVSGSQVRRSASFKRLTIHP